MNIKPTKKKVIWTLILTVLINIVVPLVNWFTATATWQLAQKYMNFSQSTGLFHPADITTLTSYMISKWNMIVLIIELALIYFLWSLFQRSRKMKMTHSANLRQN